MSVQIPMKKYKVKGKTDKLLSALENLWQIINKLLREPWQNYYNVNVYYLVGTIFGGNLIFNRIT